LGSWVIIQQLCSITSGATVTNDSSKDLIAEQDRNKLFMVCFQFW